MHLLFLIPLLRVSQPCISIRCSVKRERRGKTYRTDDGETGRGEERDEATEGKKRGSTVWPNFLFSVKKRLRKGGNFIDTDEDGGSRKETQRDEGIGGGGCEQCVRECYLQ